MYIVQRNLETAREVLLGQNNIKFMCFRILYETTNIYLYISVVYVAQAGIRKK